MITVSRAEWNARPPLYTNPLDLSQVTLFIVHYSGASRSQTVRSIQDYCMDVKGYSDIDYNAIVKDGKHYVGRGWNKGGHTLNNNSISYGVCVVGQDGDATPEDMQCVREIYDMVCTKLGRQITKTDHRRVLGTSYTDCPGDELDGWVAAGMPANTNGDRDDMFCNHGDKDNPKVWVLQAEINDVLAFMGVPAEEHLVLDWWYGDKTAGALLRIGCGNPENAGRIYGPGEYKALQDRLREIAAKRFGQPGLKGDKGDRGEAGKTPTKIQFGPVVADVIEAS